MGGLFSFCRASRPISGASSAQQIVRMTEWLVADDKY
jgi:hypothetical protein